MAAAASVVSDDEGSTGVEPAAPPTPLRFEFRGYSVWLELQDVHDDLNQALDVAARDLHVHRVPSPHVTVEYGMTHVGEAEMRSRFKEIPAQQLLSEWPAFDVRGIQIGSCYEGVDGEDMTMAWVEMTLGTSPKHEAMVDWVRRCMYQDEHVGARTTKWTPHLSLCYENPEQAKSNLHYSLTIMHRVPTLTSLAKRRITGIALWKTQGKMEHWECLERFDSSDYTTNNQATTTTTTMMMEQ